MTSAEVAGALLEGRRAALSLMTDTVMIERGTLGALNPANGQYTPTWTTIYAGPADVKPAGQQAREVDAGQTETTVGSYDVKLPFATAAVIKVEDRLTTTASNDPHLIGRALFVTAVGLGGRRTSWHIAAVDQEQP